MDKLTKEDIAVLLELIDTKISDVPNYMIKRVAELVRVKHKLEWMEDRV